MNLIFTVKKIQLHYSKMLSDAHLEQVEEFKVIIKRLITDIDIVDMTEFPIDKLNDQLKKVIIIFSTKNNLKTEPNFFPSKGEREKTPLFLIFDDVIDSVILNEYENDHKRYEDDKDKSHLSEFYRLIYQEFLENFVNSR